MSEQLKPCPFCGGEAHHYEYEYDSGVVDYSVCCNDEMACNAAITSDSRDDAIKVWNTSALTPKQKCADEMYGKLEKVAELFESLCEDDAAKEIRDLLAKARGEA